MEVVYQRQPGMQLHMQCNRRYLNLTNDTTFDQPFGNFTWNSTNQTADLSLANLTTVNGNMTVSSTGSGSLACLIAVLRMC